MKKKMLITGVSGLLGNNLAHYFKDKYRVIGQFNSHPVSMDRIETRACDLTDADEVKQLISDLLPDVIVHCASLTNIDLCEANPTLARQINAGSTESIVSCLEGTETSLIYISTDAVYDGVKGDFSESDPISPKNYYGQSKFEGENEALKYPHSLVLRTNIFGWNIQDKKSLGEWVIGELDAQQTISGFEDAHFSTIYTFQLARVLDLALKEKLSGLYNCGGANSCSKYDFALTVAKQFGFDSGLIQAASIDDAPLQTKRGKDLSLNVTKLQKALNYQLPTIDSSIEQFYRDYRNDLPQEIKEKRMLPKHSSSGIPYGRQWIDEEDIQNVAETLRSPWVTQGPKVDAFEAAIGKSCDSPHVVASTSGTASLHLACLAAGVTSGDEIITSPITFVASANCAVYCGATPVFVDIDPQTYNLLPEEIEKKITERTKAIIPVQFAGQSCDMEGIQKVVKKAEARFGNKIYVIEDASHALGSLYKGKPVGSCTFSDMAVLSFHPVKHITLGEGGATLTRDPDLNHRLRLFRSHGITRDAKWLSKTPEAWYYEQVELGYNYRITDIQCALGVSQLNKLKQFVKRRRAIVDRYNLEFKGVKYVQTPFESEFSRGNFHLYVLLFDFQKMGTDRSAFMSALRADGVLTQVHYIPVHTQPYFRKNFGTAQGDQPNAEAYYERCLSIPLFPAMTDHEVDHVIQTVTKHVGRL